MEGFQELGYCQKVLFMVVGFWANAIQNKVKRKTAPKGGYCNCWELHLRHTLNF